MPLSPVDIKKTLLERGDSVAALARRFGTEREKLSRVIHRQGQFVYPQIRRKLARYLRVPISEVGQESGQKPKKKAA